MGIRVCVFRGNGIRVGNRLGVIHRYVSPTDVLVRFKEGYETVGINELLPVSNVESLVTVVRQHHENDLELDLSPRRRDDQYESEVSDEDQQERREEEFEEIEE